MDDVAKRTKDVKELNSRFLGIDDMHEVLFGPMCEEEINENPGVSSLGPQEVSPDFLTVESVAMVFLLDVATDWFTLCLGSLVLIGTTIGYLVQEFTSSI
ncbi:hypothetical protein Tco_1318434 [Tanacetum coccineum]